MRLVALASFLAACGSPLHVTDPALQCPRDGTQSRDGAASARVWDGLVMQAGDGVVVTASGGERAWWTSPLTVDWSAPPDDVHRLADCGTPTVSAEVELRVTSDDVSFTAPGFVWIEDGDAPTVVAWWVGAQVDVPNWEGPLAEATEAGPPDDVTVTLGLGPAGAAAVPEDGWVIGGVWRSGDRILEEQVLDRGTLVAP